MFVEISLCNVFDYSVYFAEEFTFFCNEETYVTLLVDYITTSAS